MPNWTLFIGYPHVMPLVNLVNIIYIYQPLPWKMYTSPYHSVMGNLQSLMLLVKNLPMAYNRDLQEDKPPLFDSFDTITAMLDLAAPIVEGSELQRDSIASRLERGYLDATTLMEWMIKKGID